jgi:hypothetical protein
MNVDNIKLRSTSSHLIGWMELFCKFIWSPEKFPNASRIVLIASTLSLSGLMKIAVSSAYKEVLHVAATEGKGVMIPC